MTVHEKQRVNEEQPTPASSPSHKSRQHSAQTTPAHLHWCGANPPSSWLAQAASRSQCSEIGSHFHHFPAVTTKSSLEVLNVIDCVKRKRRANLTASVSAPSTRLFQACLCACICTFCMCLCIYVYVCVCADMYICMYMHVCMCMYTYAFMHMCMCMCMHICA